MARARNLKPSFFTNDVLAEIDPLGRLLFQGLWCLADRSGRLEDRPKKIKAELLPYDACDVDSLLDALAEHEFILRYESDGKRFIQVIKFCKHQNPHVKEAASSIPAPDSHSACTVQEQDFPEQAEESTELAGLIPLTLNPLTDSLNPVEASPKSPAPQQKGVRLGKDWEASDEEISFCQQERPDLDVRSVVEQFRDYWIAQPGAKGRKTDWPATWRNWVRNQRSSPRKPQQDDGPQLVL